MRDIKFRGRRTDNGEWIYGNLVYMHGYGGGWTIGIQMRSGDGYRAWASVNVDPETVGQYIGMKDKKGREICEGDIDGSDEPMYVAFQEGCFGLKFLNESSYFDECISWDQTEIVGTIHDNKMS